MLSIYITKHRSVSSQEIHPWLVSEGERRKTVSWRQLVSRWGHAEPQPWVCAPGPLCLPNCYAGPGVLTGSISVSAALLSPGGRALTAAATAAKADTTNGLQLGKVTVAAALGIGSGAAACYYCLIWSEAGGGLQSNREKVLEKVIKSCQRQLSVPGPWLWHWMQMIWSSILVEIQEGFWHGSVRHKGTAGFLQTMRCCILKLFAHLSSSPFAEFGYHWSKIFPSPHILINLIDKIYLRVIHIMTSYIREILLWNTAHLKCLSLRQNRCRQ